MPRKIKTEDPVFGRITFDVTWLGNVELDPYGMLEVQILTNGKPEVPTDIQRREFESFRRRFPSFKATIDNEILAYYRKHRDRYLENAVEPEIEVPIIDKVDQLDRILEPDPIIIICEDDGDQIVVEMQWATSFDDEHGLNVKIESGKITSIGPG